VRKDTSRWVEVTRSQFPHEAEGLAIVRELLPDVAPFRAWSNFEFRDSHGKWHEVDLLVLGRRQLHLVELKWYRGVLRGDDHRWLRDGHRAEDSPLKLARRKAQRLASRLRDEFLAWAREREQRIPDPRDVIPYVQEAVFLHHPDLRCELPNLARTGLFGLDGTEGEIGLPGISNLLLEPPTPHGSVKARGDLVIAKLLERIGVVQRRQREVANWVIDEEPLADGDDWQDWPAFHRVATTERARIRFYVVRPGAPSTERVRVQRLVSHEYRIMSRLGHDSLLKPRDVVEGELGPGLVYPHDERFQRLDLWLAEQRNGVAADVQLSVLRQTAETVAYAHRHRVVHRGLTPAAIHIRLRANGEPVVLLGDWLAAGATDTSMTGVSSGGVTSVSGGNGAAATERLGRLLRPRADLDQQFAEVFQAPEGVWNRSADRVRLDVFSLGAVTYYLLSGRAPAPDRANLRERLHRDGGLDLAADLPQVSSALRQLVLEATRPTVSERLADVPAFLAELAKVERELAAPEDVLAVDPLEAAPGAVLDGRYRLERRLGAGSTAVGLLVTDLSVGEGEERVLKVAIDDTAAQRLDAEAEVLRGLKHPRLVKLLEGPVEVGGRRCLLLDYAGEQTLAETLRGRARLSIDLLERWGTELLEVLVALDKAGVDHRDIKPANLGVREGRGDRVKHLMLFDFSLARAGATAITAGTPPYLDPFLERRGRYDSAAERYAAAVVLFEMATGSSPAYGDGQSDPLLVDEEAAIAPEMFDRSVASGLVVFFRKALARDADKRHDTAADMLAAWRAIFAPVPRTEPDDADERAAAARLDTPLAEAGLSARALSALEPLGITTVGDLVAIDPVRLNRLSGVADATRRAVKRRARAWRDRFATAGMVPRRDLRGESALPDPVAAAELLVTHSGSARAAARRRAAQLLLGLEGDLDPFASQGELGEALGVTRVRGSQLVPALQDAWVKEADTRGLLDVVASVAREALNRLGGVATVDELTDEVLAYLPPAGTSDGGRRAAAGLLRIALDRVDDLARAEGLDEDEPPLARRRRGGRVALLATDPLLLDAAEAAARRANQLVAEASAAGEELVPRERAATALTDAVARLTQETAGIGGERLIRLAARLSTRAAASGNGELHDRDLAAASAVRLALAGMGARQEVSAHEVRERMRARFPGLPALPERPRLDEIIAAAGLPLVYDEARKVYRSREVPADTTGLATRPPTDIEVGTQLGEPGGGPVGQRLRESIRSHSFLALAVDAHRLDQAVDLLVRNHEAALIDMTRVLIETLRSHAADAGVPWDLVREADAAQPGTRDAMGLAALVEQSLPAVVDAVEGAAISESAQPVVITEVAALARYGHLGVLSRWTDLAAHRPQAIWVMVPQLVGNQGPMIDGSALPLAAPGQFVRLDSEWFAGTTGAVVTEGAKQ
jgi:serine/threonine protein kinase